MAHRHTLRRACARRPGPPGIQDIARTQRAGAALAPIVLQLALIGLASTCAAARPPESGALGLGRDQPGIATAPTGRRIVSLDLCSDWLLAHFAQPGQALWLSPLAQRFPPPTVPLHYPFHDGSLESILALKPDWIVVNAFNATLLRKRLQAAGLRVLVTPLPRSLDDLARVENQIAEVVGLVPAAQGAEYPPVGTTPIRTGRDTTIPGRLLLLGPNGYGVGEGTFEHNLILRAGWNNYLRGAGHQRLDLEALTVDPPDAIAWAAPDHAALAHRFAQHRVLYGVVPRERWISTDYWRWQCPGPWSRVLPDQLRR